MEIIVGTRGSHLALTQTQWVINQLAQVYKADTFKIKVIKTKGDIIQDVALDKIGDKGIFVTEIENQLLAGEIDIAVHSMKDMPSEMPMQLQFVKIPPREDRRDVLILRQGSIGSLDEIRHGAIIATGSKRRKYQLLQQRPDLMIVPIRGNIDTRIRKIEEEQLDGIVLAAAGLHRVGLKEKISYYLPEEMMIPAPAQGALGLQIRKDNIDVYDRLKAIECKIDDLEVQAERAFLKGINGSCNIPIGATAKWRDSVLSIEGVLGDADGRKLVKKSLKEVVSNEKEAYEVGMRLATLLAKELNDEG